MTEQATQTDAAEDAVHIATLNFTTGARNAKVGDIVGFLAPHSSNGEPVSRPYVVKAILNERWLSAETFQLPWETEEEFRAEGRLIAQVQRNAFLTIYPDAATADRHIKEAFSQHRKMSAIIKTMTERRGRDTRHALLGLI